jgi:GAF domain-containing protein
VRLSRPCREAVATHQVSDSPVAALARVFDIHRRLAVFSALVVPIEGRIGVFGAVAFSYAHSGRHYKAADVRTAERVARQIAAALDHAQLRQSERRLRSDAARGRRSPACGAPSIGCNRPATAASARAC